MYFEKLALEVNATAAGLQVMKPASIQGQSGVDQKFAFLATDGEKKYGVDIVPEATEKEVMRSYLKRMDTGAVVFIISLKGRPKREVYELSCDYGIRVIGPGMVDEIFAKKQAVSPRLREGLVERV
jgi:hypothetical protein